MTIVLKGNKLSNATPDFVKMGHLKFRKQFFKKRSTFDAFMKTVNGTVTPEQFKEIIKGSDELQYSLLKKAYEYLKVSFQYHIVGAEKDDDLLFIASLKSWIFMQLLHPDVAIAMLNVAKDIPGTNKKEIEVELFMANRTMFEVEFRSVMELRTFGEIIGEDDSFVNQWIATTIKTKSEDLCGAINEQLDELMKGVNHEMTLFGKKYNVVVKVSKQFVAESHPLILDKEGECLLNARLTMSRPDRMALLGLPFDYNQFRPEESDNETEEIQSSQLSRTQEIEPIPHTNNDYYEKDEDVGMTLNNPSS